MKGDNCIQVSTGAGRYAPSPSGDLHLGNLRTALIAWLCARSSGRRFVMRIEDLDRSRDQGSAGNQLEDLTSLGIDWDGEPVWQTERLEIYNAVLKQLDDLDQTYECYCSRKDILVAPTAPHQPLGSYPGTCRNLTADVRETKRASISPRKPAIRVRMEESLSPIIVADKGAGETPGAIDDFVVMRGDGTYAYNFVSVIDDASQGVDQVVRGDDLLPSTARQIALQQMLGYPRPEYRHVPLVLGPDGKRLAKRDGAVTLSDLQQLGIHTPQVRSLIGASLGLNKDGERVTAPMLLDRFDVHQLPSEPWVWNPPSR